MKILFRADASTSLGSGHVMRCLALAAELAARGHSVAFACLPLMGDMREFIAAKGFEVFCLAGKSDDACQTLAVLDGWGGADCAVIDNYAWSSREESLLRAKVGQVVVIDDLANRRHECDVLIDQNFSADLLQYQALTPADCDLRLGPGYALLRPEFGMVRNRRTYKAARVRIFVNFGGSDPGNETTKVMRAIASCAEPLWHIDVVVGESFAAKEGVLGICEADGRFHYHCQVERMAEFMAEADLAIGGGGVSALERCAVGVPSITISIAENQEKAALALAAAGATFYLGASASVDESMIADAISRLLGEPALLRSIKKAATRLVDGKGTKRVADVLEGL